MNRCPWADAGDPKMLTYHDREWGVPEHEDRRLFEFLTLEGAQAGLSWSTILAKREGYRRAFRDFEIRSVARIDPARIRTLCEDPAIVRNRAKIRSTVRNARGVLEIQRERGSFAAYCWSFVGGVPRTNRWRRPTDVPSTSTESDAFSRDLKSRGFSFVGSTIMYAYMQAVGMANDHLVSCFRHAEIESLARNRSSSRDMRLSGFEPE